MSIDELLRWLKDQEHTGQVILHFAQGKPNRVEIPRPGQTFPLDKVPLGSRRLDSVV